MEKRRVKSLKEDTKALAFEVRPAILVNKLLTTRKMSKEVRFDVNKSNVTQFQSREIEAEFEHHAQRQRTGGKVACPK